MSLILILFDTRIRAEQSLSFVTGIFIANNWSRIRMWLNTHKYIIPTFFLVATIALANKQIPLIRSLLETQPIVDNIVELCIKYGFAATVLFFINFTPPRILGLLKNSTFLSFCSFASLEIYLVHFSLLFMINKEEQMMSLSLFLTLTFVLSYVYNRVNKNIALWIK